MQAWTLLGIGLIATACSADDRDFASSAGGAGVTATGSSVTNTSSAGGGGAVGQGGNGGAPLDCGNLTGWQPVGGALSDVVGATDALSPSVAIDETNAPVVAWVEGTEHDIHVARWDGSAWQSLPPLNAISATNTPAYQPAIAASAGVLVVAWSEWDGSSTHPYVRRWSGSGWDPLGNAVGTGTMTSMNMSLVIDATGRPVLAWSEQGVDATNVYVSRWEATSWQQIGTALDAEVGATNALVPSLALDAAENPWITWQESDGIESYIRVRSWDGAAWQSPVGDKIDSLAGSTPAFTPSLALDAAGAPVLAFSEYDGTVTDTFVKRWDSGSWQALGMPLSAVAGATNANLSMLQLDASGAPVVMWSEPDANGAGQTFVYRYDGAAFQPLGGGLLAPAGASGSAAGSLAIDACNRPVATWSSQVNGTYDVYVWRYHGP